MIRNTLIACAALVCAAVGGATDAAAEAIRLTPANPQPDAAGLQPGLAVDYATGGDIKFLSDAEVKLKNSGEPGEPLIGFDYPDTFQGQDVLTSDRSKQVAARISGYIRFDAAGPKELEFFSNDGLKIVIGGKRVDLADGRRPCDSNGAVQVEVPSPGWYEVKATYFQRVGTACLLMKWGEAGGELEWTPNDVFAYRP